MIPICSEEMWPVFTRISVSPVIGLIWITICAIIARKLTRIRYRNWIVSSNSYYITWGVFTCLIMGLSAMIIMAILPFLPFVFGGVGLIIILFFITFLIKVISKIKKDKVEETYIPNKDFICDVCKNHKNSNEYGCSDSGYTMCKSCLEEFNKSR